jgi:hypothetical protein
MTMASTVREASMPDARALLGWTDGYHTVCREERNVAAML